MAKFNLTKGSKETKELMETKENLLLFKAICSLGMGAAFYALFVAPIHFSPWGWVGLVLAVVGIIVVGDLIRKKRFPTPKTKIKGKNKDKYVVSWSPDETKAWCWKCREHTRPKGKENGGCSNCGASHYRMNVPIGDRKAGYGCAGCAAVPVLIVICALLFVADRQSMLLIVAMAVFFFLLVLGFPIVFIYRYRTWMKWAERRRKYPYGTDPLDLEEEEPSVADERDGFLRDEEI